MNPRKLRLAAAASLCLGACAATPGGNDVRAQNDDQARANSHDDGWGDAWVAHARSVYRTAGKTAGMVLHIGDSITHANPYTQWPRHGAGKTAEDAEIAAWSHATVAWPGAQNVATQVNGWYLTAADTTGGRGMTSAGRITTGKFLSGSENGGPAMPRADDPGEARTIIADTTYTANLEIHTVAAAFAGAQFAVLMLGTNDASGGRSRAAFMADLGAIVDALEAREIVVIPSTIPPHIGARAVAEGYNQGIRDLARERALPLIDYEAEILARRPGDSWNGTLLGAGDVHPTAQGGGHDSASNPYLPGGDPATHRTGDACREVGYLLRSWLTVQKLKEVKRRVVDQAAAGITPGDCNGDRGIDLSDGVCLLGHLFQGQPTALPCDGAPDSANVALLDANGDGGVDVSDAVHLLDFLFAGTQGHVLGLECVVIAGCPERCGV
jgi:hypothetical protein